MVLALAASGAAVLFGVRAGGLQGATGPAVVRLTDLETSDARLPGGGDGPVGGREIIRFRLFGSTTRTIGTGYLSCIYVDARTRLCTGSYSLPRGVLVTTGPVTTRLIYTSAIIGGTGLYDNARGTLTVTAKGLKPRRELLLFRLSG